ncbi:FKBP-type peptidyl-prolyl cis-trans isomerase FklB [Desulfonatronum thiosulfatophilum]|uniref:Peptidyl-prolyl cis-trans isomerase n=1 Tax=Desulfonatronum thiosulfatophilum TaxID=617002 RepID=A0A1G6BXY8_9BACT|nr:FKBP-type peptidyl-prolyl cis-trans isomerase [Desulfonatronum thiosulfatophilum]SDB25447.1 FKBP-type peptidyl-prolyl cis-trans isomerase FklB [Desulfonatronum thiosulfatophilum]
MSFRTMTIASCLSIGLSLVILGCGQQPASAPQAGNGPRTVQQLDTPVQKTSYAIGLDIGTNISQGDLDVDADALAQGLRDGLGLGGEPLMTQAEQQEVLMVLQQELMQRQMEMIQRQSSENLEEGRAFMEEFQEQEGVQATESGILYRVITEGDGETPTAEDIVTVHYTGTLVDGTVFDSSVERGEPATFPLQGVIPGWTEILQMMPQGSKWEVVIPPDMAYGQQQAGPIIQPNSTLVFEIELLDVVQANNAEGNASIQ